MIRDSEAALLFGSLPSVRPSVASIVLCCGADAGEICTRGILGGRSIKLNVCSAEYWVRFWRLRTQNVAFAFYRVEIFNILPCIPVESEGRVEEDVPCVGQDFGQLRCWLFCSPDFFSGLSKQTTTRSTDATLHFQVGSNNAIFLFMNSIDVSRRDKPKGASLTITLSQNSTLWKEIRQNLSIIYLPFSVTAPYNVELTLLGD